MATNASHHQQLPPQAMTKCDNCANTTNLRLCSKCGEGIYCSETCQSSLWTQHKLRCKLTDRIDLGAFYPFLAGLADCCHLVYQLKPMHEACVRRIMNSPNPYTSATVLSEDEAAKPVVLGDHINLPYELMSPAWWPTAQSDMVRAKLFRRIHREGFVLPILLSICTALLAKFYPETLNSPEEPRCRLRYRSSVITDFGIAKGWADVKGQDRFVYFFPKEEGFQMGQDHKDHYWIYFKTLKGEEVTLDLCMFTFNMCMQVNSRPYFPPEVAKLMPLYSPAFFCDRVIFASTPDLHYEQGRASVLRNEELRRALTPTNTCNERSNALMVNFMEKLSGRSATSQEKDLLIAFTERHMQPFDWLRRGRQYRQFPAEPQLSIEQDPGEVADDESQDEWYRHVQKFKKLKKQGKAPETDLAEAFRQWKAKRGDKPPV